MKEVFNESDSSFYDTEYFLSMESRYISGAHKKRVEVILKLMGNVSGKKILDFGCGEGFIGNELAKKGAQVTGIDYAEAGIRLARERFRDIDFKIGDASTLNKFKQENFDAVLLIDVIEHVSEQGKLLDDIKRILKPRGLILINTDVGLNIWTKSRLFTKFINFSNLFSSSGKAYRTIKKIEAPRKTLKNYHLSHIGLLSYLGLKKLLSQHGFVINRHIVYPLISVPLRDVFFRFLPKKQQGDHQCVLAQKKGL